MRHSSFMDFTGKFVVLTEYSKDRVEDVLSEIASKRIYDKDTKIETVVSKDYAGKIKDITNDGKEFYRIVIKPCILCPLVYRIDYFYDYPEDIESIEYDIRLLWNSQNNTYNITSCFVCDQDSKKFIDKVLEFFNHKPTANLNFYESLFY